MGGALAFAYNAGVDTLDHLVLGSCSFTADGWEKSFYPPGLKSSGYLGFYAQQFLSVEIDATFYGIPREKTVRGWFATTPDEFTFACKVPQVVTHQKCLIDCEGDLREFLTVMSCLEHKLGPMLLQFPYFGRKNSLKLQEFLHRLRAFLPTLPEGFQFALEIRNKAWVGAELLDILRKHKVALTLIDHPWMPRPSDLMHQDDIVTSNFAYVRMLGDRSAIEGKTKSWHETVVDRSRELEEWAAVVDALLSRGLKVYTYVNNHFAGHSPETMRQFLEMLRERRKRAGLQDRRALAANERFLKNGSRIEDVYGKLSD